MRIACYACHASGESHSIISLEVVGLRLRQYHYVTFAADPHVLRILYALQVTHATRDHIKRAQAGGTGGTGGTAAHAQLRTCPKLPQALPLRV